MWGRAGKLKLRLNVPHQLIVAHVRVLLKQSVNLLLDQGLLLFVLAKLLGVQLGKVLRLGFQGFRVGVLDLLIFLFVLWWA